MTTDTANGTSAAPAAGAPLEAVAPRAGGDAATVPDRRRPVAPDGTTAGAPTATTVTAVAAETGVVLVTDVSGSTGSTGAGCPTATATATVTLDAPAAASPTAGPLADVRTGTTDGDAAADDDDLRVVARLVDLAEAADRCGLADEGTRALRLAGRLLGAGARRRDAAAPGTPATPATS